MPEITAEEVTAYAEKICGSAAFGKAEQVKSLFRYVVEKSLAGDEGSLKAEVMGRNGFVSAGNVKVQMGFVRDCLIHYYRTDGRNDRVIILCERGKYLADFYENPRADAKQFQIQRSSQKADVKAGRRKIKVLVDASFQDVFVRVREIPAKGDEAQALSIEIDLGVEPVAKPAVGTFTEAELNSRMVILVQGENLFGENIYSYLDLAFRDAGNLAIAMRDFESWKPSDFGKVVASGRGDPPTALKKKMANKYNLIDIGPPTIAR